ncbi:hypothetical protein [Spiroplasma endosymbiont of Phyllotreta cruciferae]|uniref:hypothetical protein n=1 Tax=Spiroplasma endosymbiont of Phyllotreta cruciferae TaxID=2886375 RepID=UPI00209F8C92|nr:hypothetical protein [Spiroplasma endosymbiont of Phyllotreta cruciferae]
MGEEMSKNEIIIIIVAITVLLISIINLLYLLSKYNMKLKLVDKVNDINESYKSEFYPKFQDFEFSQWIGYGPNDYSKLQKINNMNIYFERYLIKVINIMISYGIKKYKCTNCQKKKK